MNKKIIITVVLIILIIGGFWVWKNSQNKVEVNQQQTQNQQTDMDTSDWKTYNNSKYKYSFRYPEFIDVEVLGLGGGLANQNTKDVVLVIKDSNKTIDLGGFKFTISVYEGYGKNSSLSEAANEFVKSSINNAEHIVLGGIESISYVGGGLLKYGSGSNSDIIIMRHSDNIFVIIMTNSEKGNNVPINKEVKLVQDILDSFDFK